MNPETPVQPKETKEAKEFESFTQTRPLTCQMKWRLLQNIISFGIFRFFRPSNYRIKDERRPA